MMKIHPKKSLHNKGKEEATREDKCSTKRQHSKAQAHQLGVVK
jgi:hypothetical protein